MCWPKTEAIMVLGGNNYALHTCGNQGLCPLFTIQLFGIECLHISIAISPFLIVECIEAEVDEGISWLFLVIDILFIIVYSIACILP